MLSALVGSGMKFEGKVLAQAEGDGPVSMLVGEYTKSGGLRGYARHEPERWAWLNKVNKGDKPHMPQLFGATGRLGLGHLGLARGLVATGRLGVITRRLAVSTTSHLARNEGVETSKAVIVPASLLAHF